MKATGKIKTIQKPQNLHTHTKVSDGEFSHLKTLDIAHRCKVGTLAFTDHDALPDKKTITSLIKNKDHPVKWIMGIEISSEDGLHIVGLFVDPTNKPLIEHCQKAQEARIVRMKTIVKNLKKCGFKINVDECFKASGGEAVGRPHIVQALKSKKYNLEMIEEWRKKMANDAKDDPRVKRNFDQMMQQGEDQYPYALFLSQEAYVPGVYVKYLYKPGIKQTAGLIRRAGGLAIIAHYMLSIKKRFPPERLEKAFREKWLDGGETLFSLWAEGTVMEEEVKRDEKDMRRLVEKYDRVASAGSDAHREEDWIKFAENKSYSQKTIGTVEKIIKKTGVDTTWSSLKKGS